MERILIIDDDPTLAEMIGMRFETRGYEVLLARLGKEGLRMAYEKHPDLVILDVMMPDMDGWETCRRLRDMSDVPIVMLTAKVEEEDVVRGFRLGADDYVKKPFSVQELEERVRAILKRSNSNERDPATIYDDGTLRIDLDTQQVFREGQLVHLTTTEMRLLTSLVRRQGVTVSHEDLLNEVWGPAYLDATAYLSLYIRYLREKLEQDPGEPVYIRTKWGSGYWFAASGKVDGTL